MSKIEEVRKNAEFLRNLYSYFKNFEIIDSIGNYGYIVSKIIKKTVLDEKGNISEKSKTYYNILLYNGTFASKKWFSTYQTDNLGNCIIGFERNYADFVESAIYSQIVNHEDYKYIYGAINFNGKQVVEPLYDKLEFGTENTFKAHYNGNVGYVDGNNGKQITPIIFTNAEDYSEGLGAVQYKGNYGYVDRNKVMTNPEADYEYAIRPKFDMAKSFDRGIAEVSEDGLFIDIDKNGRIVTPETMQLVRNLK